MDRSQRCKWPTPPIQQFNNSTAAPWPFSAEDLPKMSTIAMMTSMKWLGKLSSRKRGSRGRQWKPWFTRKGRSLQDLSDSQRWQLIDILLAHQLLHDQPFAAPSGWTGRAWATFLDHLSDAMNPEYEDVLVYPHGAIRQRLQDQVQWLDGLPTSRRTWNKVRLRVELMMPRNLAELYKLSIGLEQKKMLAANGTAVNQKENNAGRSSSEW